MSTDSGTGFSSESYERELPPEGNGTDPQPEPPPIDWGPQEAPQKPLEMFTKREFVKRFRPPDYLIDGILQRRYLYALTGRPAMQRPPSP